MYVFTLFVTITHSSQAVTQVMFPGRTQALLQMAQDTYDRVANTASRVVPGGAVAKHFHDVKEAGLGLVEESKGKSSVVEAKYTGADFSHTPYQDFEQSYREAVARSAAH